MSKHLLYCKDLLNRTLTRSLLFVLTQLVACLIVLIQAISPAEAAGPLSVKTTNPRYFFDSNGKSVYLTGSYLNEYNTLSGSWDFASYLDFLQQQKQNFTRVWGWEQSPWLYDNSGQVSFASQPYERTGPGLALDGGLKFDVTRFNQAYFDQLRSRVLEAAQRGIYVSVMLFEGFSTQKKTGRVNPWLGDPFQQVNNINGINGDPNRNGSSEEFFSLAFPSLLALQEAFARKVVDTLNDLDNVLYEVNGNGLAGSLSWQYHMIDYIKRYQKKPTNQHPVGISDFYAGATTDVFNSSADWIVIRETNLNPPPATSKRVLIMEGTPPVSGGQVLSTSPISLVQLLPDSIVSSQNSGISNNVPSSNGVTLLSSSATSSTLNTTKSSSNQQSKVATPTITPNGGVYSGTVAVTLQTTTPAASIYYTTDGQSPTQSSRLYTGKFTLSDSTLVKAKAFKSNFDPSPEASAWFANASTAVGPSGLVAYWKFDEASGTTVSDSSGNGNTGTLVNGPLWTAGRVGNALYFDGIDDNVTVLDSPSLNLSSSFTLSAWVNPTVAQSNFTAAIAKNTASDHVYFLYATSGSNYCGNTGFPLAGANIAGVQQVICNSSGLPLNTWSYLTSTYDGSNFKFYVNGSLSQTVPFTGTIDPSTGTLQIGASHFGEYFKGFIDEVRIYNRALSDTEIQALYQKDSVATSQNVATPVISPSGGNYSGSVSITMQTATSGAAIYYTTNGSTPTQSSTLYTGAMSLTSSATVKAKAFKSGSNASAEASASFTVTQPFNFSVSNSGGISVVAGSSVTNSIGATLTSGSAQAVTFSASGLPTGATASFSSTSCSPTCSSTLTINTNSSTAAGNSNITVTASGGGVTKTTTFSLTVSLPTMTTVATPTITPNGGSFTSSVSVTMQTATSGAAIYYTTNGSTPTQSSTLYTGAMSLTSSATVKAKAFKSGSNASAESSASFTVNQPFSFSVSNSGNTSVVAGSSVTNSISTTLTSGSAQAVILSASGLPAGATASFSSASCSPDCSSTLTINTSSSTPAGSSTITVTAAGGGVTKTTAFSLTVSLPTVAIPIINPNGGTYTGSVFVAMQSATPGASIYYTTNGSSPTQSSTLYTGAMTLTTSTVVKARAFKSGYNASAEASASFTVAPSGLVAYWKFDEASGTSAADSSGNGNTGTLVNGPLSSAGKVGNALYFDGIDDNVTVPDSPSLNLSSSFTLSAWVNPTVAQSNFTAALAKNTASDHVYFLYATSGSGYCGYTGFPLAGANIAGVQQVICNSSGVPLNTWSYLTSTYDGSNFKFYVNGSLSQTVPFTGTTDPSTGTLQIGASHFGEYFKGFIDEVRIYNRALSDTEIQTLYQQDSALAATSPVIPNVSQPFSFSLSNSGDKSVVAGSSVTNSIAATLVSGSSQAVSFSVSGLPSGATGSFSSASCNPSCSTVFNIVTTGSTPAGNFPITVTSTGGGVTRTTAFTLSVTLALTVATPTITPNGGNFSGSVSVAMQTGTSGASIYYTTDGSTPTQSSSLYTGTMALTSSATVNAKAFKSGSNPSTVTSASFTNTGTGRTYYVAKSGSDSNSCAQAQNQSTPKLTIGAGVACMQGGDRLEIKQGTYSETFTPPSGTPSAHTVIASFGTDTVTFPFGFGPALYETQSSYIDFIGGCTSGINRTCRMVFDGTGSGNDYTLFSISNLNGLGSHHIIFDGVRWTKGGDGATTGGGMGVGTTAAHDLTFKNCRMDNNGLVSSPNTATRGPGYGYYMSGGYNTTVENCEIDHNGGWGLHQYTAYNEPPSNGNIIRNNIIHDNAQTPSSQQSTGGMIIGATCQNQLVYNNIVYNNNQQPGISTGYGISISYGCTGAAIYSNTVYGHPMGIQTGNATGTLIKNNIVYGNGQAVIDNGIGTSMSNNLTIDPKFVSLSSYDFHLQSTSPAIDAGITLTEVATDIDGNPRPLGAAYDMGAYEY